MITEDFDFIPDKRGFHIDVKYPSEDIPRYQIDLIKMNCTCIGYTIDQAKAKKEKRTPNDCKHLKEVKFRIRYAGIKLGRFLIKETTE